MSQPNVLPACGDVGVNEPTARPVVGKYSTCNYVLDNDNAQLILADVFPASRYERTLPTYAFCGERCAVSRGGSFVRRAFLSRLHRFLWCLI